MASASSSGLRKIPAKLVVPKPPERPNYNLFYDAFGTSHTQASGFIKNTYFSGLGRFVCQLQRMTIKFSKYGGNAKGVRDFIEHDIVDFARANPGVALYLKPRRKQTPVLIAEYLNGSRHWFSMHNFTRDELKQWLDFYVNRSGAPIQRFRKPHHTDWPSIQGVWTPFVNVPPEMNVTEWPNEERGRLNAPKPTATEQLIRLQEQIGSLHILKEHPSTEK